MSIQVAVTPLPTILSLRTTSLKLLFTGDLNEDSLVKEEEGEDYRHNIADDTTTTSPLSRTLQSNRGYTHCVFSRHGDTAGFAATATVRV